jgi:hypothetical protein
LESFGRDQSGEAGSDDEDHGQDGIELGGRDKREVGFGGGVRG